MISGMTHLARSAQQNISAAIENWTTTPLPPLQAADPMQPNPKTASFSRTDFLAGRVDKERVFEEYSQQPVQHRGDKKVTNEAAFKEVVGITFAPNNTFESTIATMGPALYALTGGSHPDID